jgi:HSP20 family molecular chaperone IbpA
MTTNVDLSLHLSSIHSLNSNSNSLPKPSNSSIYFKFPKSKSSGSCEFSAIPSEGSSFDSNSFEIYKNVLTYPNIVVKENQVTVEMYLPDLKFEKTRIVLGNKSFRLHVEIEKPFISDKTNQNLTLSYKFSRLIRLPEQIDTSQGIKKKYENMILKISFQTKKLMDVTTYYMLHQKNNKISSGYYTI